MIEALSAITGAIGLSSSAGLNAYLPLMVLGLTARYTNLVRLNGPWDILANGWVLAALALLLLIEMTADKIPAIDTLNDFIQTGSRPLAGAILFAAGSGMVGELHPVLAFIAGLLIAGGVHAAKTMARPLVTMTTGGMGNGIVSLLEDLLSFVIAVVAILVPLVILLVILVVLLTIVVHYCGRSMPS